MSGPREPFSWDDRSDEVPVPLVESTSETTGSDVDPTEAVVDEAEIVVREAQAELAQDDTEPAIPMPLVAAGHSRIATPHSTFGPRNLFGKTSLRAVALVAACALAFAHGWHEGSLEALREASVGVGVTTDLCDSHHCHIHRLVSE